MTLPKDLTGVKGILATCMCIYIYICYTHKYTYINVNLYHDTSAHTYITKKDTTFQVHYAQIHCHSSFPSTGKKTKQLFWTSMCKNIIISQLESNQKSTNFTKQFFFGKIRGIGASMSLILILALMWISSCMTAMLWMPRS